MWDLRRPENKPARVLLMYVCVCQNCHAHTCTHIHMHLSPSSLALLSPISSPPLPPCPYSLLPPSLSYPSLLSLCSSGEHVGLHCLDRHPHQPHLVALGRGDGSVGFWDLRQEGHHLQIIQAHNSIGTRVTLSYSSFFASDSIALFTPWLTPMFVNKVCNRGLTLCISTY